MIVLVYQCCTKYMFEEDVFIICIILKMAKGLQVVFIWEIISHYKGHRSNHRKCSIKKVFPEIFQNSLENTCARVPFLVKLQAFLEILQNSQEITCARVSGLWCFPLNFAKFLRTPFLLQKTSGCCFWGQKSSLYF